MKTPRTIALYQEERMWFYAAILFVLSTVVLYIYFLSLSVVHVVMRKEVDTELSSLSSSVSSLEAEYIEAQHSVSADIASMRGYTLTKDKIFIDRTDTTVALLND